jgi:preprotein translocase subunit SecY
MSIGILLLIFALSIFVAYPIFDLKENDGKNIYVATGLISAAVIIMLLVLWEEFLFPVKVKLEGNAFVFRNHRNKLKTQLMIYSIIPIIFGFVFLVYEVSLIRFIVWASICTVAPVAGKLISGLRNYNDFLKLSDDSIEYKNNEKKGTFQLAELSSILPIRDEREVLHKMLITTKVGEEIVIDLDEMELEAFIVAIDKFITARYRNLLTVTKSIEQN